MGSSARYPLSAGRAPAQREYLTKLNLLHHLSIKSYPLLIFQNENDTRCPLL